MLVVLALVGRFAYVLGVHTFKRTKFGEQQALAKLRGAYEVGLAASTRQALDPEELVDAWGG